ncbi:NAD(P)/FAD-dependent oxidoreductase [Tabrizicola oligotrophica]|uniref:FAD-binding oxidoreductase n=1 Tax=Tabrizicola oligotrophica TaxID=2710650 RepID=A0A6M0QRB7_9RHOB|nr:FAD-binding oxidoreductase [Tabrizicola oligotrophica]NEY89334.1 FAD-binding oxidoreductase [Tabrizicola oligotrophica]
MSSFPISEATPVQFSPALPKACEVVVLGGGIMGVMTAWYLAEAGVRVVLCEKGRIAGEQSSRNWGWIRQQGRDPGELPIMVESLRLWQGLAQEFGTGLGFRQEGVKYLALTEAEMAGFEDWRKHAVLHGIDTVLQSAAQVKARIAGHAAPWVGGMFTASDARAEPWVAVPMLATGAVARGAVIVENCAVRRLDLAAGRVAGVYTERGRIACEQVVVAGGAWSSLFLRAEGVNIPQLSVLASVAQTEAMPEVFAGNAADENFAFRRRQDGGYTIAPGQHHDFHIGPDAFRHVLKYIPTLRNDYRKTKFRPTSPKGFPDAWRTRRRWQGDEVSPFEQLRVLNPAPNLNTLARTCDHFAAALPELGRPRIKTAWAGMIDTLPDVVPILDRAPLEGLVIATGLSGHGFGIGPGFGRVMADLVRGRPVGHDLGRFRFARFGDGSKLDVAKGL